MRATESMSRVYVARTDEQAWREAGPYIERFAESLLGHSLPVHPSLYTEAEFKEYTQRARSMAERTRANERLGGRAVIGSPKTCAAKLAELKKLGVENFICWMNFGGLPHEKVMQSMRMFSREVMPHL
jgi:alkanesulfonate monooxygenase SsuD/methylene tetrahydromethanopterin reductase-like flavin-dependent oxidoreductase (luciferase family)